MDRERYDRLLNLTERSDLDEDERVEFIELAEALADSPGGIHAAIPRLVLALAHLRPDEREAAVYVRKAIDILRQLD